MLFLLIVTSDLSIVPTVPPLQITFISFHFKNPILVILKITKLNISSMCSIRSFRLSFNPKHFQFLKILG